MAILSLKVVFIWLTLVGPSQYTLNSFGQTDLNQHRGDSLETKGQADGLHPNSDSQGAKGETGGGNDSTLTKEQAGKYIYEYDSLLTIGQTGGYNSEYDSLMAVVMAWEKPLNSPGLTEAAELVGYTSTIETEKGIKNRPGLTNTVPGPASNSLGTSTGDPKLDTLRERHGVDGDRIQRGGSSFIGPKKRMPEMVLRTNVKPIEETREEIGEHYLQPGKYGRLKIIGSSFQVSDSLVQITIKSKRKPLYLMLKFAFPSAEKEKVYRVRFKSAAKKRYQTIVVSGFQQEPGEVVLGYSKEYSGKYEYFRLEKFLRP